MDLANKDDFTFFMRRALTSSDDDCYIELYNLLLRSFVAADVDFDGKVSVDEFDSMIEAAAALLRKFGYQWWDEAKCPDEATRKTVRAALFTKIDENNDGVMRRKRICVCKKCTEPNTPEYRRLYWFHWQCFQAADADRDGMVSGDEFNKMIDMATSAQKRLGMETPFQSTEERTEIFKKMDENGDGSISFDEWLNFSLNDIIAKVASL
ncbi:uncharacterized protein LOC111704149 [Eurytemora carolleeae]|uniref:uncharacterized protein LOC111704149 n=1 Tax=Eurytemora carolleeae TaxID=1294199 RepID=UPI000C7879C4|nr:uncharacterized protein LOC111704149 [Eurytemora carolleeae]|eukprot:XP_023332057.1 uncharacterized protein LOC111704149 [Eurytemora affinis]